MTWTGQHELYRKCASKLERILSKQDCDLRILVGHSNMLQSLTPAFILEYDHDDNKSEDPMTSNSDCEAESDLIACSEHVENLFPLYEVSVTERERPSDGRGEIHEVQQFLIEKSHIVMHPPVLPVRPKIHSPFFEW